MALPFVFETIFSMVLAKMKETAKAYRSYRCGYRCVPNTKVLADGGPFIGGPNYQH